MDWKYTKLKFALTDFSDMGSPFDPKKVTLTKEQKKYKDDMNDFLDAIKGYKVQESLSIKLSDGTIASDGEMEDYLLHDGQVVELNLKAFNGLPKTFKFLGMDVTDDLDCVIKGSHGCIWVGNLLHHGALQFMSKDIIRNVDDVTLSSIFALITPESLKASIETLKFKDLVNLNYVFINHHEVSKEDTDFKFNFLDNLMDTVSGAAGGFASVILNFINSKVSDAAMLKPQELELVFYNAFSKYWNVLIDKYRDMSLLMATLDNFYNLYSKLYGVDKAIELSRKSTDDYEAVGLFSGMSKGEIHPNKLSCDISISLMDSINNLYNYPKDATKFPYSTEYITTMFEYPEDFDITSLDAKTAGALSVLDGLKFIDSDLELDTELYNLTDSEQRDFYLKNAIKVYKKRFNNFYFEDIDVDIEDEIIDNIIPQENGIDILNVKDALKDNNQNLDQDVAKVSFNKTQILKACRLIKKLTDMLDKNFKEVSN